MLGKEPGKREKQMYSSSAHAKTKMGFITKEASSAAAESNPSCLKSFRYLLHSLKKSNSIPDVLQAAPTYLKHQIPSTKVRK